MPSDFLERIVARKREEIAQLKTRANASELAARARAAPSPPSFEAALRQPGRMRLIAEIKRASPSAGSIRDIPAPTELAKIYVDAGADAVSVLTDRGFFAGSLDDLRAVRAAVDVPLLRKDFVLDPLQVYEAKLAGAAAVLLIAECLSPAELADLTALIHSLEMTALVELFDAENLPAVVSSGARVIGVNNRDLRTFAVDVEHSLRLRDRTPSDRVFVSESGIKTREDVTRLRAAGVDAMLVGESLLRAGDPAAAIRELLAE